MFEKFIQGLVFGAGFGIAFVVILYVSKPYVFPEGSAISYTDMPQFERPLAEPPKITIPVTTAPANAETPGDSSVEQGSGDDAEIPESGGILTMSPVATDAKATRSSTYQLWLTRSGLWRIKTNEDNAELEKLDYPDVASLRTLTRQMEADLGMTWGQSTITVSGPEIKQIKSEGVSVKAQTLSGMLQITGEGVVYMLPDPFN